MHKLVTKILLVIAILAICTAILEAALRVAGKSPSNTTEGFFEQQGASYRLRKNMTKVIKWPSFSYVAMTNSFGFRDKQTGDRRIEDRKYDLFLGSSATFGNGVDYQESFVGVYEGLSIQRDRIEVLNLAVGGHRMRDQIQLLQEFIGSTTAMPRKIFICIDPNLITMINTIDDTIMVKDGYLFDRRAWVLPYLKVAISNLSTVYCFLRDGFRIIQSKLRNNEDEQFSRYLELYSRTRSFEEWDRYLDSITSYCLEIGAEPIFVYLPLSVDYALRDAIRGGSLDTSRYDLEIFSGHIDRYSKARNVAYIDLTPVLGRFYDGGGRLCFSMDAHYNEQASKIVGEYIFTHAP
jgi:hypothetical protein